MAEPGGNLGGGGDSLGEAWVKIRADTSQFEAGVDAARAKTEEFANKGAKPATEATNKFAKATQTANRESRFLGVNLRGVVREGRSAITTFLGLGTAITAVTGVAAGFYAVGKRLGNILFGVAGEAERAAKAAERLDKAMQRIIDKQQQRVAAQLPSSVNEQAFTAAMERAEELNRRIRDSQQGIPSMEDKWGRGFAKNRSWMQFLSPGFKAASMLFGANNEVESTAALLKQQEQNDKLIKRLGELLTIGEREEALREQNKTRSGDGQLTTDVARIRQLIEFRGGGVR